MPGPAANTNGRNHSQRRIVNDRNSPAAHVGHINLATVWSDGDASRTLPDTDVLDQSSSGSINDGDRVAQVVGRENAIAARRDREATRPGRRGDVAHLIGRAIYDVYHGGRVIRHVNEPTVRGHQDIFGPRPADGHIRDKGIGRRIDHRDVSRVFAHHENASAIRSNRDLLWTSTPGRDCGRYNPIHRVDDGDRAVTMIGNICLQPVWGHGEPNRSSADGDLGRDLIGSGIDHSDGI